MNTVLQKYKNALLLLVLGLGCTAGVWYMAYNLGYYYGSLAMLGPIFAILGIAALFFPNTLHDAHDKEASALQKFRRLPLGMKLFVAVAFGAGLANLYLLGYFDKNDNAKSSQEKVLERSALEYQQSKV
jgi:hypothetical protein